MNFSMRYQKKVWNFLEYDHIRRFNKHILLHKRLNFVIYDYVYKHFRIHSSLIHGT